MTLKFAMLLQMSVDTSRVITVQSLDSAIELTDFLKRALAYVSSSSY